MAMVDHRVVAVQSDPQQARSVGDFVDSLVREVAASEGTLARPLMRELLAGSLQRALELAGAESRRRFLEVLATNIHKFPLQEQQSLARVYPVEISSEYRNLRSFVEEPPPEEAPGSQPLPAPGATAVAPATFPHARPSQHASAGLVAGPGAPAALAGAAPEAANTDVPSWVLDLQRRLTALPPPAGARPGAEAEALASRLLEEEVGRGLQAVDAKARGGLFALVRLNLFKLPQAAQRQLAERFPDLRAEIVRLVDSMTHEVSRWLDEERAGQHGLQKLRSCFQAILSAPFEATFKQLGPNEKRSKEAFLLKMALCLQTVADKGYAKATGEIGDQAAFLRKQFFYVEGYGELMDDWLQNRLRQFNEEAVQRATAVLASNPQPVMSRLGRTLKLGHWFSLSDPHIEEDIFALFLDDSFPRHVLTSAAIADVLRRVAACGGGDFQVYDGIACLPPPHGAPHGAPPAAPMGASAAARARDDGPPSAAAPLGAAPLSAAPLGLSLPAAAMGMPAPTSTWPPPRLPGPCASPGPGGARLGLPDAVAPGRPRRGQGAHLEPYASDAGTSVFGRPEVAAPASFAAPLAAASPAAAAPAAAKFGVEDDEI